MLALHEDARAHDAESTAGWPETAQYLACVVASPRFARLLGRVLLAILPISRLWDLWGTYAVFGNCNH
jgi:hypothetical protein